MKKVSVIGSGFIAKGIVQLLESSPSYSLEKILTRSNIGSRKDFPCYEKLTNNLDELIENSDLIVECTGDAIYAADSIDKILKASLPVVTMNAEFHVTCGSYFVGKGLLTEAEGDQPGVLAMLNEEALSMGFKPLVYANMKGFLAHNPSEEDMKFWAEKQGFSLDMTTSFTDGTKVQIEQTLVANGLGVDIAQDGLIGPENDDTWEGGALLAQKAKELGRPISDYLISPAIKPGVFIVAEHSDAHHIGLSNYKMGNGPFFVLDRPYHLCYFEIIKTIDRVLQGRGILLDNNEVPTISTATIAKRDLKTGESIKKGIGSFDVRGIAVKIKENKNHIPIGLMKDVVLKRDIAEGSVVTFDDVEVLESLAVTAWKNIEKRVFSV